MTSLSLPAARRRFLAMLWLSAALHAAMIGLTRLPPPVTVTLPPELEVQLAKPAPPPQPAKPIPEPKPVPRPPRPVQPVPQALPNPQPVVQPAPQPVVTPAPQISPVPGVIAPAIAPSRETPGPQVNIPLAVDTRYYSAKELDIQPSALRRPEPVYPAQADEQGVSGRVVVRLHLEADGSISKTEVVSVKPGGIFGEMFRKSTLDSLKSIRFRPAQRNGQPVRAVVEIPVVFEPET